MQIGFCCSFHETFVQHCTLGPNIFQSCIWNSAQLRKDFKRYLEIRLLKSCKISRNRNYIWRFKSIMHTVWKWLFLVISEVQQEGETVRRRSFNMWHFDWEKLVGFCTSNIDKEMKKNWQEFSIAKDPNKKSVQSRKIQTAGGGTYCSKSK